MLLETAAALPLQETGVAERSAYVTREIAWLDRLEAAGVEADVDLVHQARHASLRGERGRLHAALRALESTGSDGLSEAASRAGKSSVLSAALGDEESVERSAVESFGADVIQAVRQGYERGRRERERLLHGAKTDEVRWTEERNLAYLAGGEQSLACALAVDGAFELGGAMTPVRVVEEARRLRAVRYPTQTMLLVPAREPADLRDALIHDPRSL